MTPLLSLARALLDLHKALLDLARIDYERAHGPVGNPLEVMRLVKEDASFAWLRPLWEAILEADAMLHAEEPPADVALGALRGRIEALLSAGGPPKFWSVYEEMLQKPEIVMAHARVRAAVRALPAPSKAAP